MTQEFDQHLDDMLEEEDAIPVPRKRYQSTLGDKDRRKITGKINIAKGRAVKLENLRKKKEQEANEIEIYSGSDSDSSDDEYVRKPKKGNKYKSKIQELEDKLISMQKKAKAKKKTNIKKIAIQLPPQAAPSRGDISQLTRILNL